MILSVFLSACHVNHICPGGFQRTLVPAAAVPSASAATNMSVRIYGGGEA
jgi:hypothetical protein